jgi:hypothetical protein
MKKYIIILGITILVFLSGCQTINVSTSPEPVIADESIKFNYVGSPPITPNQCHSYLYKYVDEEAGKIVYMFQGGGGAEGVI